MTLLNEQILNKDKELSVKEQKVITSMLIFVLRHLPSGIINGQWRSFFSLLSCVKSGHLLHSGLAQAWLYWTYLETYSLTKYDLALATCLWSLRPYIFLYSLKGKLRSLDRFLNLLRCFQLTLWKDKVSEKEKELAEALNEVRCLHVDTKIGGSVAKWLGLVLFSVVPSSGPRPRFKHS